jgi:K+-sensing histidine kinase KdpD
VRNGIRFDLQLRNGPRSSLRAYSVAVLLVIISSLLRWGMGLVVDLSSPFTTYYPAVLFATVFGGLGAGTFAAILGGVVGWWAFMPPYFEFAFETTGQKIDVLIYFIASLFVVWSYR